MNDATFDNDDNKYGKFVLHQYTNMNGPDDVYGKTPNFNDIEIPIEYCGAANLYWVQEKPKYYCSKFDESHFLHGGFTGDQWSIVRLIVHFCDNSEEAKALRSEENKECASEEESKTYFENVITGFEVSSK